MVAAIQASAVGTVFAIVFGVTTITVGVAIWLVYKQRKCPSCRVVFAPLSLSPVHALDGRPMHYEVLACPKCSNAVTLVHSKHTRYAICPDCEQRTLETPCIRMPDTVDGHRQVEVHENCHLCGHEATRMITDAPESSVKRGKVLPFRKRG